jgi:Transglycosylase SLT domain
MTTWNALPFINKVTKNQQAFGEKVISISADMDIMPEWLMVVMNNESGVNSTAHNPNGSATGLIQFTEATANDLGTSTAALASMTNVEQLDYVKKYFTKYGYNKRINDVSDTYLAVFFPIALLKGEEYVFPKWASDANPIFDINKDGQLTKAEFRNYVNNKYAAYLPADAQAAFQKKKC